MKKQFIILAVAALVLPAIAQTNECEKPEKFNRDKAEMQKHRLQLMEKSLKEIGVTEEQQQQIFELQKKHLQIMKENMEKIDAARENISKLEKSGASEAELFAAIDVLTAAQGDQMKALMRNRLQMEEILGKEKFAQFMETARSQYRKHGRRSGKGMPPKPPRLPPIPGEVTDPPPPPVPPESQESPPLPE